MLQIPIQLCNFIYVYTARFSYSKSNYCKDFKGLLYPKKSQRALTRYIKLYNSPNTSSRLLS